MLADFITRLLVITGFGVWCAMTWRPLILVAALAVAAGLLSSPRTACANDQSFVPAIVTGIGQDSCGQYLQALEDERKARQPGADPEQVYSYSYGTYVDWLDGYLTGAAWSVARDRADRMAWLGNYCQGRPLDPYFSAVLHLHRYFIQQGK